MARKPSALSKLNQNYVSNEPATEVQSKKNQKSSPHNKKKPSDPTHYSPLNKINTFADPNVATPVTYENTEIASPEIVNKTDATPVIEPSPMVIIEEQSTSNTKRKSPKKKKRKTSLLEKVTEIDKENIPSPESDLCATEICNKSTTNPAEESSVKTEEAIDYEELERELNEEEELRSRKERRATSRSVITNKICTIFMILACVYLIFLIYGALNTSYIYNDDGKIIAQKMSVEQIRALHDFEKIANEYRQARILYETALQLDYRMAAGIEDPLLIAPEYEKLLERINELAIQCKAVSVSTQYIQLHTMLNIWITTDIAVYCQNMSAAISRNDETAANQALEYRTMAYNDFSVITANIAAMGAQVDGADIKDITDWSPEKYINEQIGGIGGELG